MPLPDLLPIPPFTRPVQGDVIIPGSKSLTNRALLLAALCERPVTLTGALFSEDTEIMANALVALGFRVRADPTQHAIYVEGANGRIPNERAELFVGLAGTAARFLTALCAAAPRGNYVIRGVPQMHKRPIKGLLDAIEQQGACVRYLGEKGFFPIEIEAHGLRGGPVAIDASESSQMLSALLMVAPLGAAPLEIRPVGDVRQPFVEMTSKLMANFVGIASTRRDDGTYLPPLLSPTLRYASPGVYPIEPDATAASYFLALPVITRGTVYLPAMSAPGAGLQGDTRFMDVLQRVGATIVARKSASGRTEGVEVRFENQARHGVEQNFSEFSDTFLTLAAIAPLLDGPTRITGIAHTRKQETDRVAGMARELTKLGQNVAETEDSLTITPRPLRSGQTIETYGDHRFAMSFGILGCHDLHGDGRPWLTIKHPACCAKTFPHFFELLETLRKKTLGS
jgi:3-phosphoshikimate 1-carboxyvinyltransferase